MHSWSTSSRHHQPEPARPCRLSARHHLQRLADDLTSCAGSAPMGTNKI